MCGGMVHYCLNLVKKSTMLKVGAKVQQKNDMCKEMPYFFEHTP